MSIRPITLPMMRFSLLNTTFSALLLLLQACISTQGFGQDFAESFDNGFTQGLGWSGDTFAFTGSNGALQLLDSRPSAPGFAKVWVAANTQDSACWTLDVRLEFSPSTSNKAIWWLTADRPLDQAGVQGVYLQAGGVSGNEDAFELIRRSGSSNTVIASTSPGSAAIDPVEASLRICASGTDWILELLPVNGTTEVVSGIDSEVISGLYCGFDLLYTSTRNGLFFFDNLTIDPLFRDLLPPELVLAQAENETTIRLVSSEPLTARALEIAGYSVENNAVVEVRQAGNEVVLILQNSLVSGRATQVTVDFWEDLAGNVATSFSTSVTHVAPHLVGRYELLITEIMSDPTPVVGLPEVEYIELFNASNVTISLADVELVKDNVRTFLPAINLQPGDYVALSDADSGDARFTPFSDLPALTNAGARLELVNLSGDVIDQVDYLPAWHESNKDDGGYSLERIDLNKPCQLGGANWTSSPALSGGTPGAANASSGSILVDSLAITGIRLLDSSVFILSINRSLSSDLFTAFEFENLTVAEVLETATLGAYEIRLSQALQLGQVGFVRLSRNAASCLGSEQASLAKVVVGLAQLAQPGDWELNELMYDPLSGQGRYIELANVSDKLLSTDQLLLSLVDEDGVVEDLFVSDASLLVPPGSYVVYADNPARLIQEFSFVDQTLVLPTDVPTLGDEECLQLFDPVTEEIYWLVCYSDAWHNRAYANTDGVSLERISLSELPSLSTNWTSAASTSNFGTPTRKNSQARSAEVLPKGQFSLASETISPDGDGFEDLLSLNYTFDDPGTLARFEVFDLIGRSVSSADQDESPGNSGTWTWDGVSDEGSLAPVGTYLLRITYWSPQSARQVTHVAFSLLLAR